MEWLQLEVVKVKIHKRIENNLKVKLFFYWTFVPLKTQRDKIVFFSERSYQTITII